MSKSALLAPTANPIFGVCETLPPYERLEKFSEESGQSKTFAVERALMAYMDDYEEKQRILKKLEGTK